MTRIPYALVLVALGALAAPRAALAPAAAAAADAAVVSPVGDPGPAADSLVAMIRRIHVYFRLHEQEGITMDSRYPVNPSEAIRMGVVSQLLGYTELAKLRPRRMFQREIANHAAFLVSRLDTVRSHGPFDGMLGYSLLQAYEQARDTSFLRAGLEVTDELMQIPTEQCILNGGLMVAMATANAAVLTGDPAYAQKTTAILGELTPYQNADGSFPHWCWGSRDIHYTGWMGEELVLIKRMSNDPRIDGWLTGMRSFLEGRLLADGSCSYTGPCTGGPPGCVVNYDSQHSGCYFDYDTRDWTVEPAYNVQVFDHFRSKSVSPALHFLATLESGGTWKDKYGYIPPPDDPEYPWSIADTSVANTSINFWILATTLVERVLRGQIDPASIAIDDGGGFGGMPGPAFAIATPTARTTWRWADQELMSGAHPPLAEPGAWNGSPLWPGGAPGRPVAATLRLEAAAPNPASGATVLRYALPAAASVTLAVYDAAGRRVRTLVADALTRGPHDAAWDGRDDAGRACGAGVYFARLVAGSAERQVRIVRLR